MLGNKSNKLFSLKSAENSLFAGSSALILSLSHLYPELKFLAIIALVPFLWRLIKINFADSVILGFSLGSLFVIGTSLAETWLSPMAFTARFLCLSLIFALFALGVNRVKKHLGLNPVFIALLWLPLEYFLKNYAHLGFIFSPGSTDSGFLFGIGSLFGLLMVSFFIVLINSLILVLLRQFHSSKPNRRKFPAKREISLYPRKSNIILDIIWYYSLVPRSPPKIKVQPN
jgi:apolipoprotein N-acyltransferase